MHPPLIFKVATNNLELYMKSVMHPERMVGKGGTPALLR